MRSITAKLTEGYRVEMTNERHTWWADEPADKGGTDTAPTPYEQLLGSLAACTCITLSMYAARKGIQIDSVATSYRYDKIRAEDCDFCDDDAEGMVDTITSEIEIEGDFTDAQRQRLESVALRCPVHKTLERGITFDEVVTVR